MQQVVIRWIIRRDMPEVLAVERESFEFPWSEEDFVRCLRQRNCIGRVALHGNRVVGFVVYELHKAKLHVLNLAVGSTARRQGVGRALVDELAAKLNHHQRRTRIQAEVREGNLLAQVFLRACGFRAIGVLRDFYEDTDEDAYLFQYSVVPRENIGHLVTERLRLQLGRPQEEQP